MFFGSQRNMTKTAMEGDLFGSIWDFERVDAVFNTLSFFFYRKQKLQADLLWSVTPLKRIRWWEQMKWIFC